MVETTDFDRLARRYDAWYARPIGAWADRHETAAILRLLSLEPGERLLDLGAGTGRHAVAMAASGARVAAIDQASGMLAVAQSRTVGLPIDLARADANRLPFRDGTFDAVLAVTSLCFVADPAQVLAEAARVLRPDGRLVLGELNRWSLWALLRRVEDRLHPTTYRGAHFRGIRELRALLTAAGFSIVRWHGVLYLPPLDRAWFLHALDPIERMGQRLCPAFGAFLAIEARLTEPRLTAFDRASSRSSE